MGKQKTAFILKAAKMRWSVANHKFILHILDFSQLYIYVL